LDITYYLNNRHKLYGQLLIDDYQIDDDTPGDNEPNEIGILAGIYSLDFLGLCVVEAEYLRIANRTYNQQMARTRYENRGALIGHGFGPDGDRLSLSFAKWYEFSHRMSLNLVYQRKGEGRYDNEWTSPWDDVEGDYSEPFPTGVVEKTLKADIRLAGFFKRLIFYDLRAGLEDVSDFGHVADDDRTVPFFSLRTSLILSGLLSIN
ncbi:MAG: hypothetical protein JSU69_08945, partial [Candidatus Zixiibacteriota bacterium]